MRVWVYMRVWRVHVEASSSATGLDRHKMVLWGVLLASGPNESPQQAADVEQSKSEFTEPYPQEGIDNFECEAVWGSCGSTMKELLPPSSPDMWS